VDDKVKIRCPACTRIFHEKAGRVRDGFQVNCSSCNRLLTLTKEAEDPFIRRALKTARELRAAKEAELYAATYAGGATAPTRETP
jgi:transposase-like protein